jgi:hypothetical protein
MTTTHPATAPTAHRAAQTFTPEGLRRTAAIVGWLFIVTYVTSITAKIGFYPPIFEAGYITSNGDDSRVLWGVWAEAILIIANIGTATVIYPILKRQNAHLALGFVAARIMESVFIAVGMLSVLTLVSMRASTDPDTAGLPVLGDALVTLQEWTFSLGPGTVVAVGNGMILGYLMWRSGLVPRYLSILGLIGGPLLFLTGSAAILGIIEPGSAIQSLSAAPEFFWELSLGIYLIVKGFRPSPITANPANESHTAGQR